MIYQLFDVEVRYRADDPSAEPVIILRERWWDAESKDDIKNADAHTPKPDSWTLSCLLSELSNLIDPDEEGSDLVIGTAVALLREAYASTTEGQPTPRCTAAFQDYEWVDDITQENQK